MGQNRAKVAVFTLKLWIQTKACPDHKYVRPLPTKKSVSCKLWQTVKLTVHLMLISSTSSFFNLSITLPPKQPLYSFYTTPTQAICHHTVVKIQITTNDVVHCKWLAIFVKLTAVRFLPCSTESIAKFISAKVQISNKSRPTNAVKTLIFAVSLQKYMMSTYARYLCSW